MALFTPEPLDPIRNDDQPARVFKAPADLPDDPATLQAILRAALAEIERLQFQLAGLKRNRFGRRSEKLDETKHCNRRPRTWNSRWPKR